MDIGYTRNISLMMTMPSATDSCNPDCDFGIQSTKSHVSVSMKVCHHELIPDNSDRYVITSQHS